MAESLHRETRILALQAELKNLEFFVKKPELHESRDREGLRKQLFDKYDELVSLLDERGRKEIEDRRSAFLEAERVEQEQALDARIAEMEVRIKKGGYKLPVEEKLALSELLVSHEQLFKLNPKRRTAELVERTRGLKKSIEELEARRRRTQEEYFSSGGKRSLIRLLDEKKDGVCEYWYESGARKAQVEFKAGVAHGKCLVWHEGGAIQLEAVYRGGKLCHPASAYSSNGVKVMDFQEGLMRVRLWNGALLGCYRVGGNILIAKLCVFLRLAFNFKIWQGVLRSREGRPDHVVSVEFSKIMRTLGPGFDDVFSWVDG